MGDFVGTSSSNILAAIKPDATARKTSKGQSFSKLTLAICETDVALHCTESTEQLDEDILMIQSTGSVTTTLFSTPIPSLVPEDAFWPFTIATTTTEDSMDFGAYD